MRFRKRELCMREYIRILTKDDGHELINLLTSSIRVGLRFCPLEYIRVMSKELDRTIAGYNLIKPEIALSNTKLVTASDRITVFGINYFNGDISSASYSSQFSDVNHLISTLQGQNIMIFTDGSVWEGSVGSGSCASVLFPKSEDNDGVWIQTLAVGTKVSAFECEVEGVGLGITMAIQYLQKTCSRNTVEDVYIFCDCENAINSIDHMNFKRRPDIFLKFQHYRNQLQIQSIRINLVKVAGHDGLYGNELADKHSRDMSKMIAHRNISAPSNITINDAYKIANEISMKSWQRYWDHESKGRYTYNMIPSVGTKVIFPHCRDIGISYCRILLHDTMLKSDSYRTGTSDIASCECGKGEETIEHFSYIVVFMQKPAAI